MKNAFFSMIFLKKNSNLDKIFFYFGVYIAKMYFLYCGSSRDYTLNVIKITSDDYINNTKITSYILNHNCLLSLHS